MKNTIIFSKLSFQFEFLQWPIGGSGVRPLLLFREPENEPDPCNGYPSSLVGNLLEVHSVVCFNVA